VLTVAVLEVDGEENGFCVLAGLDFEEVDGAHLGDDVFAVLLEGRVHSLEQVC